MSKYKAIREAKNIIAEEGVSIEDRELYNLLEERFPKWKNAKLHTALQVVLWTGVFVNGQFMMPATRDCMEAWKKPLEKKLAANGYIIHDICSINSIYSYTEWMDVYYGKSGKRDYISLFEREYDG